MKRSVSITSSAVLFFFSLVLLEAFDRVGAGMISPAIGESIQPFLHVKSLKHGSRKY